MRSWFFRKLGALTVLSAGFVLAQQQVWVRGQISADGNLPAGSIEVELENIMGDPWSSTVTVHGDGDFEFDSVPAGEYRLRVISVNGVVLHQEVVSTDASTFVAIRLHIRPTETWAPGTVSVRQLQRKVPKAALKEWEKSEQAIQKGDLKRAIGRLKKAVGIYPDYMEAHLDLGFCYSQMNQWDTAISELQKARELEPDSAIVNENLGAALFTTKHYAEAAEAARKALKADASREKAHLVLGLSLTILHRGGEEALYSLRRVAARFPSAHLAAAEVLAQGGRNAEAAQELRLYLKSSAVKDERQSLESWLNKLEQQQP